MLALVKDRLLISPNEESLTATPIFKSEPNTSFKELEVVQLATHLINPGTKSWKVLVPYKFKQLMEQDTMYPTG